MLTVVAAKASRGNMAPPTREAPATGRQRGAVAQQSSAAEPRESELNSVFVAFRHGDPPHRVYLRFFLRCSAGQLIGAAVSDAAAVRADNRSPLSRSNTCN